MALLFQPGQSSARHLVHHSPRPLNWTDFPQKYDDEGKPIVGQRAPSLFLQPSTDDKGYYYGSFFYTEFNTRARALSILPPFITGSGSDTDFSKGFNIGYVFDYADFRDTYLSFNATGYIPWQSENKVPHIVTIGCSISFGHLNATQLNAFHGTPDGALYAQWPVHPLVRYDSVDENYRILYDPETELYSPFPLAGASQLNVHDHFYLQQPYPFSQRQYLYLTFDIRISDVTVASEIILNPQNHFYFSLYSSNKDSQLIRNTYG